MTEDELAETLRQMSLVGVAALDEVFMVGGDRSERTTLGDTIPDSTAGPVAVFEDKEAKEILAKAISQLGDREKTVLSLYYYEGLTLAEIGEILGVTESRVCQIHTKAVLQLRTRLSDRRADGTQVLAHAPGRAEALGGSQQRRALTPSQTPGCPASPGQVNSNSSSGYHDGQDKHPISTWRAHGRPDEGVAPGKDNRWGGNVAIVTTRQLLEAGVHFGHQTRRWNPKMRRFILGERNGIYIIDLRLTLKGIEESYSYVRDLVSRGGVVLFVGTKKQTQGPVATYRESVRHALRERALARWDAHQLHDHLAAGAQASGVRGDGGRRRLRRDAEERRPSSPARAGQAAPEPRRVRESRSRA